MEWEAQTGMCKHTRGHSGHDEWQASRKIRSIEELEVLLSSAKPRTSPHRSPGGERRGKRKRSAAFLEGTTEVIVSQASIGTVLMSTLGKRLRDGEGRIWVFPSALILS